MSWIGRQPLAGSADGSASDAAKCPQAGFGQFDQFEQFFQPAVEAGHLRDDDRLDAAGIDVDQERVVPRAGRGGVRLALMSSSECVTASVQPSPSM